MGQIGDGKSRFIDDIGGHRIGFELPTTFCRQYNLCSTEVAYYEAFVDQEPIYLVTIPGFHETQLSDVQVTQLVLESLVAIYDAGVLLKGFIYLHDVGQPRLTRSAIANLLMIQNMCGKDAYGQVVLVTTGWLETPTDAEAAQFEMKEGQLKSKYWDSMLSKGARYVRHNGSTSSAEDIARGGQDIEELRERTHEGIIQIIDTIWALRHPTEGFNELTRAAIRGPSTDDLPINNSIHLALRLWLTLDIQHTNLPVRQSQISWDDNSTLTDFVFRQFNKRVEKLRSRSEVDDLDDNLAAEFNAHTLRSRRQIKTEFTYNLANHMRRVGIIPEKAINETVMSLGLLFPENDETTSLLSKDGFDLKFPDFPFVEPEESPRILDFEIWQDRVEKIYQIFRAPPSTWRQRFREDPSAFFTFWGAAVTITFATVVFGFISAVTAFIAIDLAQKSLDIAADASASATTSYIHTKTLSYRTQSHTRYLMHAYLIHRFLLDSVPKEVLSHHDDGRFYLRHADNKGDHILVDDDYNTTGILDWEWAHTDTKSAAFNSPVMLLPVAEFYDGNNQLGQDELVFAQLLQDKGHADLAGIVREGRILHQLDFCCGYDLADWEEFLGIFRGLRKALDVDGDLEEETWREMALARYRDNAQLNELISRHR
ncbi:hypothetical protein DPV78_008516 [Talaromyces pinophilus]|nr:hypothetical protein DPV78_008516 [Talaromyces pinophilus]